jgi:MFS family permease
VLIGGIVLGLLLGLAAGGSIWNLARVRLEWAALLFGAVVVRFGTEAALGAGLGVFELLRLPLFALAYGMLLAGLWRNRAHPGMSIAFVGIASNAIAIAVNGGRMPIWEPSLLVAGFEREDVRSVFHFVLDPDLTTDFFLRAGPLGDIIPIPIPFVQNVASVGDLILSVGLAFFLFATVVRSPQELDEDEAAAVRQRLEAINRGSRPRPTSAASLGQDPGLAPGLAEAAVLDRPPILGSPGAGMATPAHDAIVEDAPEPQAPALAERARRHPYVRLALNPSFSALWTGQLISLFGDRLHQIALTFLVYETTGSVIATAGVFLTATLPNLLISPIAGTFVDRWDHREVMVVSDLLRAGLVLLMPIAAAINLALVYPLIFLLTTVSIFFRPARVAILPRLVKDDELLPANSALWVSENMADVVGYPLAGLFVAFLGAALPLAFWIDAATYIASAVMLWTIAAPRLERTTPTGDTKPGFFAEMGIGWGFLRKERTLFANTIQATVGQFTLGVLIALTAVYASDSIAPSGFDPKSVYAFLEASIGVGNLIGGAAIGLIGARLAKGKAVIVGYAMAGLATALLGFTNQLPIALGLMLGTGIANMVFVIPSQTLFQERTPGDLIGRVVGFRFALVFGSMALAMAVGGVLGEIFGPSPVIAVFGLMTLGAGLAGLFVPAVRDA